MLVLAAKHANTMPMMPTLNRPYKVVRLDLRNLIVSDMCNPKSKLT